MIEGSIFNILLLIWLGMAIFACLALLWVSAPYGRYARSGWGQTLSNRWGWFLMEAPSSILFLIWFISGKGWNSPVAIVFLVLWEFHYIYRAFVYPFIIHDRGKRMPIVVALAAGIFNLINTYFNGRYLFTLSGLYPTSWLHDPRFIFGVVLYAVGSIINRQSDGILRQLRKEKDTSYHIPYGGLFRWISSPNYLGEIIEWLGWAIATWSIPGLSFAIWTYANLVPRALANHRWYQEKFPDYPKDRQALFYLTFLPRHASNQK
jgi:3-oxo-5-alpha-steroid 4-dehydrogenase 1